MYTDGWHFEAKALTAFLIPSVVIPAILLVLAFLQPTKRQMARWAAVCGVTLTDTNREQVRTHLTRGRRFRSLAAFPFWWLTWIPFINAGYPSRLATPIPAMATYLVGALVAEVTGGRIRTPATAERRAALLTRTMDDYAPRWIQTFPYVLLATGVLSVMLALALERPDLDAKAAAPVALAVAFAAGALLVGHAIVRRPQRGSEPDMLAADDALRATGISTALAAASLSGLTAASIGINSLMPDVTGAWGLLVFFPVWMATYGMVSGLFALVVRQETWGYRRRHRQRTAANAAVPA